MNEPPDVHPATPAPSEGNGHGPVDGPVDEPLDLPFTGSSHRRRPWYRRWVIWAVVVAVIVGATVVSDLPQPQTVQQQVTVAAGVVREISTGVSPCIYAVKEAFYTFLLPARSGTLSKSGRGIAHEYLSEDQQACSFESTSIFGMSTITVPSSPAGAHLSTLVKTALDWATSDANGAIVAIRALVDRPTDAKALHDLASRENDLAADRATAERELRAAERDLNGAKLPSLGLPALPVPSRAAA